MKSIILKGIMFMIPFINYGQEWATVGSCWTYTRSPEYWFRPANTFSNLYISSTMKVIGDTTIQDKNCKVLDVNKPDSCNPFIGRIYAYNQSGKIYYYLQDSGYFSKLYDFSLQVGDSMKTMTRMGLITTYVDSIKQLSIGDTSLQQQFIHYKTTGVMDAADRVFFSHPKNELFNIEGIGNSYNFFYWWFGLCHNVRVSNLRCFEGEDFKYHYSPEWINQCDSTFYFGENSLAEQQTIEVKAYPNPGSDWLRIETQSELHSIKVYNLYGKLQLTQSNSNQINTSLLPQGIYILECLGAEGGALIKWLKR